MRRVAPANRRSRRLPILVLACIGLGACDDASDWLRSATGQSETPAALNYQANREFPALVGRVVDQANLLKPQEEAVISRRLAALEARTTDQLVVVTVNSLHGLSIEEYTTALGNRWGIGRADVDNGVLLVVAPAERELRIGTGVGIEHILTDERAAQIIREMVPHFRSGSWYRGIDHGTASIARTMVSNSAPRGEKRGTP